MYPFLSSTTRCKKACHFFTVAHLKYNQNSDGWYCIIALCLILVLVYTNMSEKCSCVQQKMFSLSKMRIIVWPQFVFTQDIDGN